MIANLCLLLAPALAASAPIQDTHTPPAQEPAAQPLEAAAPAAATTPPPEELRAETQDPAKAPAPAAKSIFSYTYGQLDIIRGDGDGYDDGPNGIDLLGSYQFPTPGLFVFGGLTHLNGDVGAADIDTNIFAIGLGYHTPVTPKTDLVAGMSVMHANTDTGSGSADGDGFGLDVSLRHMAADQIEVNGGIGFSDFEDSDSQTALHVGMVYYASPQIGICGNLSTSDDFDYLSVGIRYIP